MFINIFICMHSYTHTQTQLHCTFQCLDACVCMHAVCLYICRIKTKAFYVLHFTTAKHNHMDSHSFIHTMFPSCIYFPAPRSQALLPQLFGSKQKRGESLSSLCSKKTTTINSQIMNVAVTVLQFGESRARVSHTAVVQVKSNSFRGGRIKKV